MRPETIYNCTITILCILLLAGCANQGNGKAKPDPAAFEWAMDQDIRFNTLLDECEKFDSSLAISNKALRQEWKKQYWSAINAANDQFNQQQAAKTYSYNGEKISLPAAKFMVEHKNAALREIYYQKRLPDKQIAYCQLRIAAYEKKEDGLGNPQHKNRLQYLNELAPTSAMIAPRAVPALAGSLQPSAPGPALYDLERQAQDQKCNAPQILTLRNEDHDELYGVYCTGSAGYFVSCEWSQCSVLK
jgi:hypothetical protein